MKIRSNLFVLSLIAATTFAAAVVSEDPNTKNRRQDSHKDLQEKFLASPTLPIEHRVLIFDFLGDLWASLLSILNIFDIFNVIPDPSTPTPNPTSTPSMAPTNPPTPSPTPAPVPLSSACSSDLAGLYFAGHNEACSFSTSNVNITWSPAFATKKDDNSLIWCGKYTYYIFTSKDEDEEVFFARVNDKTVPELIDLANADPNDDFFLDETTELSFEWTRFTPGINYTILVTAATDQGLYSINREPARLEVSTSVPQVKSSFTKVVVLPGENDSGMEIESLQDDTVLLFYGELPPEIDEIGPGIFFYADAGNSNSTAVLLLCVEELDPATIDRGSGAPPLTGETFACSVSPADVGEIFDELDANADVFDSTGDLDDEELNPLSEEEEAEIDAELDTLDDATIENLCIAAFRDSADPVGDCVEEGEERAIVQFDGRTRRFRRFRRRMKKLRRRIRRALDRRFSLGRTVTFVDIDEGASMTCTSESGDRQTEIGVGFDFSAHARFKIVVRLLSGFESASLNLFGGFGVKGYALLAATLEKRLQPKPKKIFERSNRRVFFIGPVPVVITIRPNLSAFTEAALVVESEVLVAAQFGYDYDVGFAFTKSRGFERTFSFVQRPIFEREPVFDLRINAAAEVGFTFAIDVVLYGLLQGTVAADLGLGAEIEVGTNVEALVVTQPYFYTLSKFELDAFVRIRVFVGLNSALTNVIRKVEDLTGGDDVECTISRGRYVIPDLPSSSGDPELPGPLETAIENANGNPLFANRTEFDLDEFLDGLVDDFSPDRGALEGQSLGEFVLTISCKQMVGAHNTHPLLFLFDRLWPQLSHL